MDMRPAGGGHWYNPNRDFIPVFIQLCRETCHKLTVDSLSTDHAVSSLFKQAGITIDHMGKAAEALAQFILIASEEAQCTDLIDALHRSGMMDLPQPVLMVLFARIAQSCLGRFWGSVRNASMPELVAPTFSKEALLNSSELMQQIFSNKTNMDLANALKDMKKWSTAPVR